MKQQIIAFEKDPEGHWLARLACGHGLHMRHNPPWTLREWVLTEAGRQQRLGTTVHCSRCEADRT